MDFKKISTEFIIQQIITIFCLLVQNNNGHPSSTSTLSPLGAEKSITRKFHSAFGRTNNAHNQIACERFTGVIIINSSEIKL